MRKSTLLKRIEELEKEISFLLSGQKDPKFLLECITGYPLPFTDYSKMEGNDKLAYYNSAQAVLTNEAFNNTVNYLTNFWAEWALKQAGSFEAIRDVRMSLNGILLLKEFLEKIPDPRKSEPTTDDLFAPI